MPLKIPWRTSLWAVSLLLASCTTATVGTQSPITETAPPSTTLPAKPETEAPPLSRTETATETTAGTPQGTQTPQPQDHQAGGTQEVQPPSSQTPDPVQAAVSNLSQALNIPESQVQVVSVEPEQWPDSCLGLAEPGEMCLQVITPGYLILLNAEGREYEVHTDETGSRLRLRQGLLPSSP